MDNCANSMLENIDSPTDLKRLNFKQLDLLCAEIREKIIDVTTKNGGHLASNLGVVELTIALHKVLNLPEDSIVWDVGHQIYTHKLLTGRRDKFHLLRKKGGVSGFPHPSESEYDSFISGHASTSISVALGLLVANKIKGVENKVVAVIGDGALTGGLAFEGLNNAGYLKENLIVIFNDNKMSISSNVGALAGKFTFNFISSILSRTSIRQSYQIYKNLTNRLLLSIPLIGKFLYSLRRRVISGVKAIFFKETIFSELGFEYIGPIDGHNVKKIVHVLQDIVKLKTPVVLHIRTKKGKGSPIIEANPDKYHSVSANTVLDDSNIKKEKTLSTWTEIFSTKIVELAKSEEKIVAITAAMASGTGLNQFKKLFPNRFFDTGISEAHAVTFSAGLAKNGVKPFVAIYSTFIQRAVDQIIHDVAIQNLPVVFILDRAGVVPADGETHQGIFDSAILKSIPNLQILFPSTQKIFSQMLDYCVNTDRPTFLRIPKDYCLELPIKYGDFKIGEFNYIVKNKTGCEELFVSIGSLINLGFDIVNRLTKVGREVDLIDLIVFDPKTILKCFKKYKKIYFLEDGIKIGSISETLSSIISENSLKISTKIFAIENSFPSHATRGEILDFYDLNIDAICKKILKF